MSTSAVYDELLLEPSKTPHGYGIARIRCDLFVITWCCTAHVNRGDGGYSCDGCKRNLILTAPVMPDWSTVICVDDANSKIADWISVWTGLEMDQFELKVER